MGEREDGRDPRHLTRAQPEQITHHSLANGRCESPTQTN